MSKSLNTLQKYRKRWFVAMLVLAILGLIATAFFAYIDNMGFIATFQVSFGAMGMMFVIFTDTNTEDK